MNEYTDDYYERKSYEVLEQIADEFQGKPNETVISNWKKAYPFGERKGRKYKIWNKLFNHARKCLIAGTIKYH